MQAAQRKMAYGHLAGTALSTVHTSPCDVFPMAEEDHYNLLTVTIN